MHIAIVSDSHDNIKNFNKIIDWLNAKNITTMLHCGDICNQSTINEATANFKGTLHFVRGNGDFELRQIPENMELTLGGKKIFFNHYPDIAKTMAESGKYDLVFYGHTHRPWEEKVGNCRLINPGEVAGQRYKPTFAVYNTEHDALELKILEKMELLDK